MVIDAYNNIWTAGGTSDYLTAADYPAEDMLQEMDEAAVDMAVVTSLGQMVDNTYVEDAARRFSDRLIPFAQVNPRLSDSLGALATMAATGSFRGLKLHPTMHGYPFADHGLLDPIFEACQRHRWIILVNALDDPFCAPLAVEEVARGFPEVPVLLAHMGTAWNTNEALIVAGRHEHIYLETSGAELLSVRDAYAALGSRKIIMGTDWPGSSFELERLKIAKAIPDERDREQVEGGNLARLLGL